MASTIKVEGFRQLDTALRELGTRTALRLGRVALRKAANEILREARARVPVKEGRLRKALRVRVDRARDNTSLLSAMVYVSATAFDYRPKTTFRKTVYRRKRDRKNKVDHGYRYQIGSRPDVYGRFIEFGAPGHGIAARPFMRGAWASKGGTYAIDTIKRELAAAIAQELINRLKR